MLVMPLDNCYACFEMNEKAVAAIARVSMVYSIKHMFWLLWVCCFLISW